MTSGVEVRTPEQLCGKDAVVMEPLVVIPVEILLLETAPVMPSSETELEMEGPVHMLDTTDTKQEVEMPHELYD